VGNVYLVRGEILGNVMMIADSLALALIVAKNYTKEEGTPEDLLKTVRY